MGGGRQDDVEHGVEERDDRRQTKKAPEYLAEEFTCPYCREMAHFEWHDLYYEKDGGTGMSFTTEAVCEWCDGVIIWDVRSDAMLSPLENNLAPTAHKDMPSTIRRDYLEAAAVCTVSPRAAAVLLRRALNELLRVLGCDNKPVETSGLPAPILNVLRALGLPGAVIATEEQMAKDGDVQAVLALFEMVNRIVDVTIAPQKALEVLTRSSGRV